MHWYQGDDDEDENDLMYSPALLARRASESWIDSAPIEVVHKNFMLFEIEISEQHEKIFFKCLVLCVHLM